MRARSGPCGSHAGPSGGTPPRSGSDAPRLRLVGIWHLWALPLELTVGVHHLHATRAARLGIVICPGAGALPQLPPRPPVGSSGARRRHNSSGQGAAYVRLGATTKPLCDEGRLPFDSRPPAPAKAAAATSKHFLAARIDRVPPRWQRPGFRRHWTTMPVFLMREVPLGGVKSKTCEATAMPASLPIRQPQGGPGGAVAEGLASDDVFSRQGAFAGLDPDLPVRVEVAEGQMIAPRPRPRPPCQSPGLRERPRSAPRKRSRAGGRPRGSRPPARPAACPPACRSRPRPEPAPG